MKDAKTREQDIIAKRTERIRTSKTWERKGTMKKKSQHTIKWVEREFQLERDCLVYYKAGAEHKTAENFSFTMISLSNVQINILKTPEIIK
jgi:hypothetical protein